MSKVLNCFIVCSMCFCSVNVFAARSGLGKGELEQIFGRVDGGQTCRGTRSIAVSQVMDNTQLAAQGDHPCVGQTRNKEGFCQYKQTACYGDEFGYNLLIAVPSGMGIINGYMFCPRSAVGRNKHRSSSWTQYHRPYWGDCHVLCAPGFAGEKCEKNVSDSAFCDTNKMNWENYQGLALSNVCDGRVWNDEDNVWNWWANVYSTCNGWLWKEHDLIFAVADWLESGHGAWVRPYVIFANQDDAGSNTSWINIAYGLKADKTIVPRQLWCKRGYKPTADNKDCIAINEKVCDLQWCGTWDSRKFDSKKFTLNTDRSCLQWRCIDTTQALAAPGSTDCSTCIESARDGVNPEDGTCIHCGTGKVFDDSADTTGYCSDTHAVTKTQMKYGPYGSKDSKIQDQCWTFDDDQKYKICITEGADAAKKYVPETTEAEPEE